MASVKQMLQVAFDIGVTDLEAAYSNYTRHYDLFFKIEDVNHLGAQFAKLDDDLEKAGLIEHVEGEKYLKNMSVAEALQLISEET